LKGAVAKNEKRGLLSLLFLLDSTCSFWDDLDFGNLESGGVA
jgi:hypothetical protein